MAAPRRPDAERMAVWRAFLEAHAVITDTLTEELRGEQDLPLNWYDVLSQLADHGGRLRMQELAHACLVNKSSLTRLVDRMTEAGLVSREQSAEDKRGYYAVITSKGREVLKKASPVHLRGVQKHFAQYLTDTDVAALGRIFAKLAGSRDGA